MKINIDLHSLQKQFQKHISIALTVFLAFILLLESLVIKRSVDMVRRVHNQPEVLQTRVVRVDIQQYKAMEKRQEANMQFEAVPSTLRNPFGLAPKK